MASSDVKRAACEQLRTYLATAVPSLSGKIEIAAADPEQKMVHPGLQIIPHSFTFEAMQSDAVYGDDINATGNMVLDLGDWIGTVELRLVSPNQVNREKLEAAILSALNPNENAPGLVTLTVPSFQFETALATVVSAYTAPVCFDIGDNDWKEEFAWDKHRFTFIELEAQFPMLVLRQNVTAIDQLIVELTEDTETQPVSAIPASSIESVEINDDGTITEV